ncbi:MAG: nuclear transport factor 2 family protein [Vicinamibacterales bacterium]|nr:nuclear transport factor 2 family protein [Vicinamibacterales bacterium]
MRKLTCFVLCGMFLSVASGWAAPADPKDEKAVMDTLEAMAKATIAKDVATLNKIYSEDLTYSHSSAQNQNKTEVLEAFKGPSVGEFMKFSDMKVRTYGSVALAKGICDFRNGRPGSMTDNHLNILWVLVKGAGPYGWQIVARQTTRIQEPAAPARGAVPAPPSSLR